MSHSAATAAAEKDMNSVDWRMEANYDQPIIEELCCDQGIMSSKQSQNGHYVAFSKKHSLFNWTLSFCISSQRRTRSDARQEPQCL